MCGSSPVSNIPAIRHVKGIMDNSLLTNGAENREGVDGQRRRPQTVDLPWDERLAELRRRTASGVGKWSGPVIFSTLLSGTATFVLLIGLLIAVDLPIHAYGAFHTMPLFHVVVLLFSYWINYKLWLWRTKQMVTSRVRMVTAMLSLSDMALLMADPHYRLDTSQRGWRSINASVGPTTSLEQVIKAAAGRVHQLWAASSYNAADAGRCNLTRKSDPAAYDNAGCLGIGCVGFLVLVFLTSSPWLIPLLLLILPAAGVSRSVTRRSVVIAVCDYLVDNEHSEFYRGWSMRVRQ